MKMNTNKTMNSMETKTKVTTNRKNKKWMRNPDQLKSPKLFSALFIRNADGSFEIVGGNTRYLKRVNQHSHMSTWQNVDTRDFAVELRQNKLHCR